MWYQRASIEHGYEKLIDLQVCLVPHTERPGDSYRELERALRKMTEPDKTLKR